jgi:glycosyltransferase involved in cell wall biosynthesis
LILPTISIVIPTFNSAKDIKMCLDSILSQTYDGYEIIIQDGKSTDDTLGIIASYSKENKYIIYNSETDLGVYDAMNKAISLAKGKWLYFLGSDDILHDNEVLSDIAAAIKDEESDIIYGDVILSGRKQRFGGEFDVLRLHTVGNLCHQAVFYNKSVFEKLGKYNLVYKINADWDFNIRCFRHPDIRRKYIPRLIAVFDELNGLSGQYRDENIYRELPVGYLEKIKAMEYEVNELKNSREYILGKQVYNSMKKIGLVSLLKRLKNIR